MLAGQLYAPKKIKLIDVAEPKLDPDSTDEIIFQPELGCLCASDLPFFEGRSPDYEPSVGHTLHEIIGTVTDSSGKRFSPGDRALCVPVNQLGLFERFRASENRAIPLDPRPKEEHALMAQPLGTVIYALKKIPALMDMDVAVVGQGPIGQLFCAALSNLGARRIIAIDPIEARLKVSPLMGANHVINPANEDPVESVARITDGAMVDLAVEAVGHQDFALNLCIDLCGHAGRIIDFGIPPTTNNAIRFDHLFRKNITLYTSVVPRIDREFELAMRWISEGRIDVSPIITHRYPLSEIQLAFETFHEKRDGAIKVLIDFPARSSS